MKDSDETLINLKQFNFNEISFVLNIFQKCINSKETSNFGNKYTGI